MFLVWHSVSSELGSTFCRATIPTELNDHGVAVTAVIDDMLGKMTTRMQLPSQKGSDPLLESDGKKIKGVVQHGF